jgi:hypothetical protein
MIDRGRCEFRDREPASKVQGFSEQGTTLAIPCATVGAVIRGARRCPTS